jgi:hypothetical protein
MNEIIAAITAHLGFELEKYHEELRHEKSALVVQGAAAKRKARIDRLQAMRSELEDML